MYHRQEESTTYVEVEKDVQPTDLICASSLDPSRGQKLNRHETQGVMKIVITALVLMMFSFAAA